MEIDDQEEGLKLNPWAVEALEEFLYFCCPECNIKSTDKDAFVNHVWSNHPKVSNSYFESCNYFMYLLFIIRSYKYTRVQFVKNKVKL